MAFLGISFTLGKHGGGVHQWNTTSSDVQYNYQVGLVDHDIEIKLTAGIVDEPW